MTVTGDGAARHLVDIACNYVPGNRPAKPAEKAALQRFLMAYVDCPRRVAELLRIGLSGKRPRPTLNAQLASLRASLDEAARLELMRNLYGLMVDIDSRNARIANFTHFIGAFLGVADPQQAALREEAARRLTPRTPDSD
jgi:hypothetical protein